MHLRRLRTGNLLTIQFIHEITMKIITIRLLLLTILARFIAVSICKSQSSLKSPKYFKRVKDHGKYNTLI
jgi:hypothetical protein